MVAYFTETLLQYDVSKSLICMLSCCDYSKLEIAVVVFACQFVNVKVHTNRNFRSTLTTTQ
jgi:hypothetical protein